MQDILTTETITQIVIFIIGVIMILKTIIEIVRECIKYIRLKITNKDCTKQLVKIKTKIEKLEVQATNLIIKKGKGELKNGN